MKKFVNRKLSGKDNKKGNQTESNQDKGGLHFLLK